MRANSPSSFFVSLTIHAFAAALVFVSTVYLAQKDQVQPVIFERVAGPPTAPDELEAPALGNTKALVSPPAAPAVVAPAVVPPAEPEKIPEVVPEQLPEVKPAPAPKPEKVEKAKPDTSIAKSMKRKAVVSYLNYLKKHPTPKPVPEPARPAANVKHVDATGIAEGVRGGSTANTRGGGGGNALTREEHDQLDTYFSLLQQELKKAYEAPPGVSDRLEARVTFDITASGSILNPRISKSSGDKEFDEAVLAAFRRVRSIGPVPTGKSDTWSITFRMTEQQDR